MLAYRLLLRRGEWDVDRFFREIPAGKWAELKIANLLIESYDAWLESAERAKGKPWKPPDFTPKKKVRRRLGGGTY